MKALCFATEHTNLVFTVPDEVEIGTVKTAVLSPQLGLILP